MLGVVEGSGTSWLLALATALVLELAAGPGLVWPTLAWEPCPSRGTCSSYDFSWCHACNVSHCGSTPASLPTEVTDHHLGSDVNGNPDVTCRTDYNFADKCRHACIVSYRGSTPALPLFRQACSHVEMLAWWHVGNLAWWNLAWWQFGTVAT